MRRVVPALALAVLGFGSACSPVSPDMPGKPAALTLTITPNPVIAVRGDAAHPFAVSHFVLSYAETAGVGLTVASEGATYELDEDSWVNGWYTSSSNFKVPAGGTGSLTYDLDTANGHFPPRLELRLFEWNEPVTKPDGRLTVSWHYTDANGYTVTNQAYARVVGQ